MNEKDLQKTVLLVHIDSMISYLIKNIAHSVWQYQMTVLNTINIVGKHVYSKLSCLMLSTNQTFLVIHNAIVLLGNHSENDPF